MALAFYGETHFMSHATGETITSAGREFPSTVLFRWRRRGWTLLDAFRGINSHTVTGRYTRTGKT
ncbi:MAG: hypothetical protein IPN76_30880 [Saprospiraceae bacterium]|nr:hypothetical protein [Saprospiraceae bacterium]